MSNDRIVLLRAEAKQLRNGRVIHRGETFTAPWQEAQDLIALSFASLANSREVVAEQVEVAEEQRPKRRYRRRDMRAEN